MKRSHPHSTVRPAWLCSIALAGVVVLGLSNLHAANGTWQGPAGTQSWDSASNWVGGSIPGSTTSTDTVDDATFDGAAGGASLITIDPNRNIRRLLFTSTTYSYTIGSEGANGGNALLISDNGAVGIQSNVAGAVAQTINAPLIFQGTYGEIWSDSSTAGATVTVNGNISYAGSSELILHLRGRSSGANVINGNISDGTGGGVVSIRHEAQNYGVWTLAGTNTFTGSMILQGGPVRAGSAQAFGQGANILIGSELANRTIDLDLNGFNNSVGTLNTAPGALSLGRVLLGAGNLTVSKATAATGSFAGAIIGSGGVTVGGAVDQTLSGANNYSGGTTIQGNATLRLAATDTLQSSVGLVSVNGGALISSVASVRLGGGMTVDGGTVIANGGDVGTIEVATARDFTMLSGTLELSFDGVGSFDQILGDGGLFAISGGVFDLTNTITDYDATYQLLDGFASGSVSGITFINYDDAGYLASLDNTGLLSFTAVPEPSVAGLLVGGALLLMTSRRRS